MTIILRHPKADSRGAEAKGVANWCDGNICASDLISWLMLTFIAIRSIRVIAGQCDGDYGHMLNIGGSQIRFLNYSRL